MHRSPYIALALLAAGSPLLLGQVAQDRPELCGSAGAGDPVQPAISATSSATSSILNIHLKDGSTATVHMEAAYQVREICPIGDNRVVAFGLLGDRSSYGVAIVDLDKGIAVDSFWARSPAISPDRRWLALREIQAVQTEVPITDEYMLYDLKKGAAGNKMPGPDYRYVPRLGRAIYPVVAGHVPLENTGVSPEQVHTLVGDRLFWSDDSRALLFPDQTPKGMDIVVVGIDGDNITAYVHHIGQGGCVSNISYVHFHAVANAAIPDIRIDFGDGLCPPLFLRAADFKPVPNQVYKPKQRKPAVLEK